MDQGSREDQSPEVRQDADAELVEQVRSAPEGDLRAFEKLIERHRELVITNCRYLTRSADDAPDLAQEVFLKAYFGLPRFEGRSTFKSWIQRIKLNHCLNHLRKNKDREFVDVQEEGIEAEPQLQTEGHGDQMARGMEERQLIELVLDRLPDTLRIPLLLCDLDGLSYNEIAEDLGIGLSATKMRIKRGREEFRRIYAELQGGGAGVMEEATGP